MIDREMITEDTEYLLEKRPLLAALTGKPEVHTGRNGFELKLSTKPCPQLESYHGGMLLKLDTPPSELTLMIRVFIREFERGVAQHWSVTNG